MPRRESIHRASRGRYRYIKPLGRGGTADVDLVEEVATGRVFVGKSYRLSKAPEWKDWELFERGAQIMAGLDHPAIPAFKELIRIDDSPTGPALVLIEEYIPGRDLGRLVSKHGRVPVRRAVGIAMGLLRILAHLHEHRPPIIHRDVKPSNVLMRPDGTIVLVDFGAVQQAVIRCTTRLGGGGSTVVGTYGFMPPEQYMGRAEPASDVYAVGVLLVFLLSATDPSEIRVRQMRLDHRTVVDVEPRLHTAIDLLTAPAVEERVATCREAIAVLSDAIRPVARSQPAGLTPALDAFIAAAGDDAVDLAVTREDEPPATSPLGPCPGCGGALVVKSHEPVEIDECTACGGMWLDDGELELLAPRPTLERIHLQTIARRLAEMRQPPAPVVYRRCPRCDQSMNRVNFGRVSGVVIDLCTAHGVWLDAGELERIRAFMAAGGMELGAEQQRRDRGRRQQASATPSKHWSTRRLEPPDDDGLGWLGLFF